MPDRPPRLEPALVEAFVTRIPLVAHARKGGHEAREVVELLEGAVASR